MSIFVFKKNCPLFPTGTGIYLSRFCNQIKQRQTNQGIKVDLKREREREAEKD
jgi:hypothetical protein